MKLKKICISRRKKQKQNLNHNIRKHKITYLNIDLGSNEPHGKPRANWVKSSLSQVRWFAIKLACQEKTADYVLVPERQQ